jgi:hypothetical protein
MAVDGLAWGGENTVPGRHPPSLADIHYPGGQQVLRCFTWLDMSEQALMSRVYCIYYGYVEIWKGRTV